MIDNMDLSIFKNKKWQGMNIINIVALSNTKLYRSDELPFQSFKIKPYTRCLSVYGKTKKTSYLASLFAVTPTGLEPVFSP